LKRVVPPGVVRRHVTSNDDPSNALKKTSVSASSSKV
jgi:hypothetical protein